MHGSIKLFSGTGCPALADEISQHLNVPLSGRHLAQFPTKISLSNWMRAFAGRMYS